MGILESISTVLLVIILLIVGVILIVSLSLYRTSLIEREEDEFDAAKREAMRRKVGVSLVSEREIIKTVMYMARNRIGGSIIIEGERPLLDIEDTGDSFGFGTITSDFLNTIMGSFDMSKGATLIRRDHVVAYNCKMPIFKYELLIKKGAGNRHLGAMGTMLEYPDSVIIVVSGTTGKISMFGHLGTETSIDFGMQLKETDIINGVGEDELVYRLHTLIENVGLLGDLNSDEIQREITMKTESKEDKKERIAREKAELRAKKEAQQNRHRVELTQNKQEERKSGKGRSGKKKSSGSDGGGLSNAITGIFKRD